MSRVKAHGLLLVGVMEREGLGALDSSVDWNFGGGIVERESDCLSSRDR